MSDAFAQSENERVVSNLIRIGIVTALDEANARVQVDVGGITTDWIPWANGRAGATRSWSAPRIGEQLVIISPYGDMAQAVALGSIYQNDHPAPANSKDIETTIYPDGSQVSYDSAANTLTVNVAGNGNVVINCKQATVAASTSVTLNTPTVHATGNVTVDGDVTATGDVKAGSISLKNHTHLDPQGGNTSPPV